MLRRWQGFAADVQRVRGEVERDSRAGDDAEDAGRWLRDYDTKTFAMKPVMVAPYGAKNLWRHARRWLLMSATIISTDEMVESLGIPLDAYTVTVPMTFPVENRPVVIAPVANVTYKSMDEAVPRLAYAIGQICRDHPGERVLVHTVAYGLNDRLVDALRREPGFDRTVVTYRRAADREQALRDYSRAPGAVLLSPSMERGVDLPGDLCRVVVVAKVPFPALGDKRVSARVHLPGGQQWYTVQAIRDVVQMTGRGVRSADDHATTYILDKQFVTNLYGRNEMLFPKWWRDAVDMKRDTRRLVYPQ
jgi:Rad3-related DNA helicase